MMLDKVDIITLSNDQKYVVAELLDYNDQEYLMLLEVDGEKVFDQAKFVKTKKLNQEDYSIQNIDNKDELYNIIDLFFPLFEQDYIEN